jgi:hypothetical protein
LSPRAVLAWLVALLVLGLALRWPALERNLPCDPEPDAVLVKQALYFDARWRGDELPVAGLNTQYPPLLGALLASVPGPLRATPAPGPLEQQLRDAAQPYRHGRWFSVLFGLALVPLTYAYARRRLEARWALVASFLVATSTLHALYSTQARPHAALTTLLLLALFALVARARSAGVGTVGVGTALGAGCASALAVACLHNGFAILAPLAAVEVLCMRRARRWFLPTTLLVLLPVVAAAWVSYPELFGRGKAFEFDVPQVASNLNLSGHLLRIDDFNGAGFGLVLRYLYAHDPALLVLGLVGLALGVRALAMRGRSALFAVGSETWFVAAVFGIAYLAAIGIYARTFGRFVLPLVPLLALAGAHALRAVFARRGPRALPVLALLLCVCGATLARVAWVWSQPTTREQFATWARSTCAADTRIALPIGVEAPLALDAGRIARLPRHLRTPWSEHVLRLAEAGITLPGPIGFVSGRIPGTNQVGPEADALVRAILTRPGADYVLVEPDDVPFSRTPRPDSRPAPARAPDAPRGSGSERNADSETGRANHDHDHDHDHDRGRGRGRGRGRDPDHDHDRDREHEHEHEHGPARGWNASADESWTPEIGRRRFPRGHKPPPGVVPVHRLTADDERAPVADPLGYSLDDWTPARLWTTPRFGQRLDVYLEWAKKPENDSGK